MCVCVCFYVQNLLIPNEHMKVHILFHIIERDFTYNDG